MTVLVVSVGSSVGGGAGGAGGSVVDPQTGGGFYSPEGFPFSNM
jgi:hypothetical protein